MRLRSIILFLGLSALCLWSCDNTSTIEDPSNSFFIKFYGADGDQTGNDLVVLPDGSIMMFGTTRPTGKKSQWYLVKLDANGHILKELTYGGPYDEEARDIELTADGRLVVVGNSYTANGDRDILLMTLTLDGAKIDSTLVGYKNKANQATDEDALSVSLTNDGFIVAGSTSNTDLKPTGSTPVNDTRDALHARFFNNLTVYPPTWTLTQGPGTVDVAVKVIQISSSQFYLFGYSNSLVPGHPTNDVNYWVFPLGPNGDANNQVLFIGNPNTDELLSSVAIAPAQTGDGYILSGITYTTPGTTNAGDVYIARLRKSLVFNALDNQTSPKSLSLNLGNGLPNNTSTYASRQSGFYVLTDERSFNDNQNWLLTKWNTDVTTAFQPIVFGGEGLDDCGKVEELPDGRLLILGTMRTGKPDAGEMKMTLIKVNSDGKLAK